MVVYMQLRIVELELCDREALHFRSPSFLSSSSSVIVLSSDQLAY